MNNAERALKGLEMPLTVPLAAARLIGRTILYLTERAVASNPELPRIGANIQIFEGGLAEPEEAQSE